MRIIGCDLHARQQTLAMLDTETGEFVNQTLLHEAHTKRAAGYCFSAWIAARSQSVEL
jgi:hypothetical protein